MVKTTHPTKIHSRTLIYNFGTSKNTECKITRGNTLAGTTHIKLVVLKLLLELPETYENINTSLKRTYFYCFERINNFLWIHVIKKKKSELFFRSKKLDKTLKKANFFLHRKFFTRSQATTWNSKWRRQFFFYFIFLKIVKNTAKLRNRERVSEERRVFYPRTYTLEKER